MSIANLIAAASQPSTATSPTTTTSPEAAAPSTPAPAPAPIVSALGGSDLRRNPWEQRFDPGSGENPVGSYYWYNLDTGETSYGPYSPMPSGQVAFGNLPGTFNEGSSETGYYDPITGAPLNDSAVSDRYLQQLHEQFLRAWEDPNANYLQKAHALQERFGLPAVQRAYELGVLPQNDDMGSWIAARQAEADDQGLFGSDWFEFGMDDLIRFGLIAGSAYLGGAGATAMGAAAGGATAGAAAGAAGGATGAFLSDQDPLTGALLGAGTGGIAAPAAATMGGGMLGTAGGAALGASIPPLVQGRSLEDTIRTAGISGLTGGAVAGAAPFISEALAGTPELDLSALSDGFDIGEGVLAADPVPLYSRPAGPTLASEFGLSNPISQVAMTTMGGDGMLPFAVPTSTVDPSMVAGAVAPLASEEQQELTQAEESPAKTSAEDKIIQRDIRLTRMITKLLGLDEGQAPEGAPQRDEGETEEQYAQEVAEYAVQHLGLDAETMAAAGLEPGSDAYYQYIMEQADSIIMQLLGDTEGLDAEALTQQLRGKTQEELLALQRAVFVRGQLGLRMRSGMFMDPATGRSEAVLGEGEFDPNIAAYQRGLARDVSDLSDLRGSDAAARVQELLGRNVDWFGMGGEAAEKFEQARQNERESEESLRRRRGMFTGI